MVVDMGVVAEEQPLALAGLVVVEMAVMEMAPIEMAPTAQPILVAGVALGHTTPEQVPQRLVEMAVQVL